MRGTSQQLSVSLKHLKMALLMSVSGVALITAGMMPQTARAADYSVSNEADLRSAINNANLQSGPSTITLTGDIAMTSIFNYPTATRPITIITNGHRIEGLDAPAGSPPGSQSGGSIGFVGPVTFNNSGVLIGGDGDPAVSATGGFGFSSSGAGASLTNTGTITGGAGSSGTSGSGGIGAQITNRGTGSNDGTIRGGAGGSTGTGGLGLALSNSSFTNNNLIEGGAGGTTSGRGGFGISFSGTSTLTNNGTIRGGTRTNLASTGAHAIVAAQNSNTIVTNYGTIEGGAGGVAISTSLVVGTAPNFTLINDGTISAGAGQANAIQFTAATGTNVLELHSNSVINGNVVATTGGGDTLRLGGDANASFNLSNIGAAAQYRNFDTFEKTGASTWTVTGTVGQTTNWSITGGTLAVNGTINGTVAVGSAGRLGGTGTVGTTTNAGVIAPGNSIGTLFINGDYAGAGGTLEMEAELGATGSPADRLVVSGNVTGTTTINVVNVGGTGAATGTGATDGMSIVQVGGTSSASAFQLAGGYAAGGPYRYQLVAFDPASSAAGEMDPALAGAGIAQFWDYRLQSLVDASGNPVPVPQIAAYQGMPSGALRYGSEQLDSLHERLGEIRHAAELRAAGDMRDPTGEFFLRQNHSWADVEGDDAAGYNQETWFVQFGGTLVGWDVGDRGATLRTGAAISIGGSDLDVDGSSASVDLKGTSLALTSTYQGADGWYIDGVVQGTRYSSDVTTAERGRVGEPSGWGAGASVAGGYPVDLGNRLILEPQAQLAYQHVWFDGFTDVDGIAVDLQGGDSLRGRLGGRVQKTFTDEGTEGTTLWSPFVSANLLHEFLDGDSVTASGVSFETDNGGTSAELAGGLNVQIGPHAAVFAQLSYEQGLTDAAADAWGGTAGLRLNF